MNEADHLIDLLRLWANLEPDQCRLVEEGPSMHPDWPDTRQVQFEVAWHKFGVSEEAAFVTWHPFTLYVVEFEEGVGLGFGNHPLDEYAVQGLVQRASQGRDWPWRVERDEDEHLAKVERFEARYEARGDLAVEALLRAYLQALVEELVEEELEGEDDERGALQA